MANLEIRGRITPKMDSGMISKLEEYGTMFNDFSILIVDDAAPMRDMVKYILKKVEFKNILEAANGKQAWNTLRKANIDLVIADWNMPELDGLGLLKKIRADARFETLPVIMVTGEMDKENVVEAIQAGATDYVLKPLSADIFLKKVIHALQMAEKPAVSPAQK